MAAVAGIIVFGTLMAAMFIGQQYLQNVLGYSTLDAGMSIIPAAVAMVLIARPGLPHNKDERRLLAQYHAEDTGAGPAPTQTAAQPA